MAFNKDKSAPKPGAERMDTSRKITKGGKVEIEERHKGRKKSKNGAAITAFLFCILFAFLYSQYYVADSALVNFFENANHNKTLFGPGYGVLIGDPMIDQILTVVIRAVFFLLLFGIVPFATFKYATSRNVSNQDVYKLMWGMTAFLFFVAALLHTLAIPFAADIMAQFQLDTN